MPSFSGWQRQSFTNQKIAPFHLKQPEITATKTSSITPTLFVYFCKWTFNLSISVAYIRYMDLKSTKNLIQCQLTVRPDFIRIKKCSVIKTQCLLSACQSWGLSWHRLCSPSALEGNTLTGPYKYRHMVAVLGTPSYKYTSRSVKIHHHHHLVEKLLICTTQN